MECQYIPSRLHAVTSQMTVWAGLILRLGFVPEKVAQIEHRIPIWNSVFPGVWGFKLSSYIYRVSQEERTKLWEGVSYVKLYLYNPEHLYPKLNGYGDNGKRSLKL